MSMSLAVAKISNVAGPAAFVDAKGKFVSTFKGNKNKVLVCLDGALVSWGNDFVREKQIHENTLKDLLQIPTSDLMLNSEKTT